MSGHSKWAQIKHQKGAADKKRSGIFSKLSKNITVAARDGGNPEFNFRLRLAIDLAKGANMPKDNIERAVAKGTGEDTEGAALEEILYEGFGPSGAAFLIEAITDNRNRSSSFLKATLSKYGGALGSSNSVRWMFEKKGIIRIPYSSENELAAIDAGAEDVRSEQETIIVFTKPQELEKIKQKLGEKNITTEEASVEYIAKDLTKLSEEDGTKAGKLEEELEENEDINAVYTNISNV